MSDDFVLNAVSREDTGKGSSRRLRRLEDQMPAIVYGGNEDPVKISIPHKDIMKASQNEAFYSQIISLHIDGESEEVLIKDLQRHPAKPRLVHADFFRIVRGQKLTLNVPLHFINEEKCHGVKMEGGQILHSITDIEIICLPRHLPQYIEVDMIDVKLGDQVHLSDIVMPEGIESTALAMGPEHDLSVAAVNQPKAVVEEEPVEDADADADAAEDGDAPAADDGDDSASDD